MVVCMSALAALIAPATGQAATFEVNTTTDSNTPGACTAMVPSCSLREAVAAASASPDLTDQVNVPAGDYPLALGDIEYGVTSMGVLDKVSITGAGARATKVIGDGTDRIFTFNGGSGAIEGMTITGGTSTMTSTQEGPGDGGAIFAQTSEADTLSLSGVTLAGNSAMLNGGAIASPPESGTGTVAITIDASTISDNHVTGGVMEGGGGGIYTFGDLTITNSTITANSAENPGVNMGGGVLSALDMATAAIGNETKLLNTTIANNTIGGAMASSGMGAGFAMVDPTMGTMGTLEARNTIVANNTINGAIQDCSLVGASTSANSLSSDTSCQFNDGGSKESTDPQLAALADNGGPTNTLAIAAASPAFNAGTNTDCPATDQRGTPRPQGPSCDIGAFELLVVPPDPNADLAVSAKAKTKARLGKKLRFKFRVTNNGPATATGVALSAKVSKKARKAKPKGECKLKGKKRKLSCAFGDLAPGESRKAKLTLVPTKGKRLKARVTASSTSPDPSAANNRAKKKVKLKPA